MFFIEVKLKHEADRSGLEALDTRRRLGLKDGSLLRLSEGACPATAWVTVDERFARLHFPPSARHMRSLVPLSMLVAGDLADETNGRAETLWAEGLTDERVKELFVAGEKSAA